MADDRQILTSKSAVVERALEAHNFSAIAKRYKTAKWKWGSYPAYTPSALQIRSAAYDLCMAASHGNAGWMTSGGIYARWSPKMDAVEIAFDEELGGTGKWSDTD